MRCGLATAVPAAAVLAVASLAAGCGAPPSTAAVPRPGSRAAGAREVVRYEVELAPDGRLDVFARLPPGLSPRLFVEPGAEPFLEGLSPASASAPGEGEPFVLPCARGCELRYAFDLPGAAETFDHVGYARRAGGAFLAPPSTWLLHPREGDLSRPFELSVRVPAGQRFASGLAATPAGDAVGATLADLPGAPYAALGAFRFARLEEGGATVDVALVGPPLALGDEAAIGWVREASRDVAALLGAPAVPHAAVLVESSPGRRFSLLTALGNGGASIHAPLGRHVDATALAGDWRMTHEFIHLGGPSLARAHDWLSEGLATYLEPIARLRRGRLTEEELWSELVTSLPLGQPGPGDRGLDRTRTWGRTYWGGALFCLVADVEARQRTGGARSLLDGVRAVHRAGGDVRARWSMRRFLEVADGAIGAPVLTELYERHRHDAVPVDLPALWQALGVGRAADGRILLDDGAPLAAIRRGIVRG